MVSTPTLQTNRYKRSKAAFAEACQFLPGGVNSPVRAYKAVGGDPITVQAAKGAIVTDIDTNQYIDYVGSYGPLILGHAPEPVIAAITNTARGGTSFGMPTELETKLAAMVVDAVASIDIVRFVNSGTEAVMSAIRLARAATGRPKVIKCTGCYHGHSDSLLIEAGSGAATLGVPSSPGIPTQITQNTVLIPFNDVEAVSGIFSTHGDIACVVIEPIAGNMGCIPPKPGYLQRLRDLCDQHGALLIFDEVMTGFRVAYGGAQELYSMHPDLTCLGKIVGGGLPCAAYGGTKHLMQQMAPQGPVYQAGTLSGNPLAMAAGIATLQTLRETPPYDQLDQMGEKLVQGLKSAAASAGICGGPDVQIETSRVGSMVSCFFSQQPITNYEQAITCDTDAFAKFFIAMLGKGVMLPPSQFETWFVSHAHDEPCIQQTIDAAYHAFVAVSESRSTETPPDTRS